MRKFTKKIFLTKLSGIGVESGIIHPDPGSKKHRTPDPEH
jgi:hypothetical protein